MSDHTDDEVWQEREARAVARQLMARFPGVQVAPSKGSDGWYLNVDGKFGLGGNYLPVLAFMGEAGQRFASLSDEEARRLLCPPSGPRPRRGFFGQSSKFLR